MKKRKKPQHSSSKFALRKIGICLRISENLYKCSEGWVSGSGVCCVRSSSFSVSTPHRRKSTPFSIILLFYDINFWSTEPNFVQRRLWRQYILILKGKGRQNTQFFGRNFQKSAQKLLFDLFFFLLNLPAEPVSLFVLIACLFCYLAQKY